MGYDDYIVEFYEILEAKVTDWAHSLGQYSSVGPYSFTRTLASYVNYYHYEYRDKYCALRHNGSDSEEAMSGILFLPKPSASDKVGYNPIMDDTNLAFAKWKQMLEPLKGCNVYYANIQRMMEYIMPFVKSERKPLVIVSEGDIDYSGFDLPESVTVLRFVDSRLRIYRNDFMERHFPVFFSYANTIILLDMCIEPPKFSCVCGCQSQSKIWADVCNSRGGDSLLYQHGWPAFMHAGFANMPFRKMALWGSAFAPLWAKRNPGMQFAVCGYPYRVKNDGSHSCVTFFLQEPYYVASSTTLDLIYGLIIETAKKNPGLTIQYRIHPESDIPESIKRKLASLPNITDVSQIPIEDVYASTRVAVSHYSSTIMECIVHGCCPLVFNPTPQWQYIPNLEDEHIGFVSTSPGSFAFKLKLALDYVISPEIVRAWFGEYNAADSANVCQHLSAAQMKIQV